MERQCKVYVLFGKVMAVLNEPGLHFLWPKLGLQGPVRQLAGQAATRSTCGWTRPICAASRSIPRKARPMGIGIWYEMFISDPVAYLFKNADPRGSLAANVSNATVRCLSNLKLADMLENRHAMSLTRPRPKSPRTQTNGATSSARSISAKFISATPDMIKQIEEKVVNRLRQVTSAIKQDGANQVSIITSTAERQAAIEFAKAGACAREIVGAALQEIARDPDVADSLFEILEAQALIEGEADLTLMPQGNDFLRQLQAGQEAPGKKGRVGVLSNPQPPRVLST